MHLQVLQKAKAHASSNAVAVQMLQAPVTSRCLTKHVMAQGEFAFRTEQDVKCQKNNT